MLAMSTTIANTFQIVTVEAILSSRMGSESGDNSLCFSGPVQAQVMEGYTAGSKRDRECTGPQDGKLWGFSSP